MSSLSSCVRCGRVTEVTPAGICADCSRSTDPPSSVTRVADPAHGTGTFEAPSLSAAETGTFTDQGVAAETPLPTGGVAELESRRDREEMRYLGEKGYRVERKLGSGGYGTVWLATDAADRRVAVKVLHRYLVSGLPQDRFTAEAKVLAALKHDGLIELYHFDRLDADPFLVTEYVPGGTLAEKLKRDGPMPPLAAAACLARVAEVVQYLHENKVIHRDLKPSNILLNADGSPKVGDFGLAKWEGKETLTPTGQMVGGTPEYGAPEQFRGGGKADARTDVYALGATLFCTLVGRPPFQRMPDSDLVKEIDRLLHTPTPVPSALNPDVSGELEAVCLKAMEKNPRDRFQTAGELAAELGRIARGEPTVTRPPTQAQKVRRWAERNWKVLSALAAVLMVGVIAAAVWPQDPLKRQQSILAEGKPYTAIPEKGLPAYYRWLGDELPLLLTDSDGACSFQAVGNNYLELVPDPMTDEYVLQGEVKHVRGVDPPVMGVGLFIGRRDERGGKTPTYSLIRLEFSEFPRPAPPGVKRKDLFEVSRIVGFRHIDGANDEDPSGLAKSGFQGQVRNPGPWRVIRAEVGSASVRVLWGTAPDKLVEVKRWTAEELSTAFRDQSMSLKVSGLDVETIETSWNPRRSIGVWAAGSIVAFRNVVISPKHTP